MSLYIRASVLFKFKTDLWYYESRRTFVWASAHCNASDYTGQWTYRKNEDVHPCSECDSKPQTQFTIGQKQLAVEFAQSVWSERSNVRHRVHWLFRVNTDKGMWPLEPNKLTLAPVNSVRWTGRLKDTNSNNVGCGDGNWGQANEIFRKRSFFQIIIIHLNNVFKRARWRSVFTQ
jgi:hypothetical protein